MSDKQTANNPDHETAPVAPRPAAAGADHGARVPAQSAAAPPASRR
ncbi:hypothetical protein ACFUTV_43640 [Streptomyces sp. NPDC057298]